MPRGILSRQSDTEQISWVDASRALLFTCKFCSFRLYRPPSAPPWSEPVGRCLPVSSQAPSKQDHRSPRRLFMCKVQRARHPMRVSLVCTENSIRVDDVTESPELGE